jgi:hypothetical protein
VRFIRGLFGFYGMRIVISTIKTMKAILIAASVVGLAAAGLIIYLQKISAAHDAGGVLNAAPDGNGLISEGMKNMERPSQHAMG